MLTPVFQLGAPVGCQWPELKAKKFLDIKRTFDILVVKSLILGFVELPVNQSVFHQKAAPQIIAVPVEQSVIEIKKSQRHDYGQLSGSARSAAER